MTLVPNDAKVDVQLCSICKTKYSPPLMALSITNPVVAVGGDGGADSANKPTKFFPYSAARLPLRLQLLSPLSLFSRTSHITAATNNFTPRKGKFNSKNRRSYTTTTKEQEDELQNRGRGTENAGIDAGVDFSDDGFVMPELPGNEPDFWEGPQWDALGFFVEYMWAFGIVFALIACGIAVATYNEGATDFKETPRRRHVWNRAWYMNCESNTLICNRKPMAELIGRANGCTIPKAA
ncbi:hypothetical protein Nepgr_019304 [Nepenthes gracilis]|uniref:Uncharacterized protein n=1 Tax=Nepenthes gracilis TaxID=150966 RepID=A0AAD3ST61_NEPGR|nr:hypothetical protein Nepgr_019304 [Nepenthes gracilis]